MTEGEAPDAAAPRPPATPEEQSSRPTLADRWILALFSIYVGVLLVGAWAQLTDNRAVLDLFDLHRWFTR